MRYAAFVLLALVTGCTSDGGKGPPAPQGSPQMPGKGWEYKIVSPDGLVPVGYEAKDKQRKAAEDATVQWNKLGEDGWEFVPHQLPAPALIFKRPRK